MRRKSIRVYAYEFREGVFYTHFKRDDLPVKPRKGKYTFLSCCPRNIARQSFKDLKNGYFVPASNIKTCGGKITDKLSNNDQRI